MKHTLTVDAMQAFQVGELQYALRRIESPDLRAQFTAMAEAEDYEPQKMYSVMDGVGIYRISGPLLSTGNDFTRWLGYVSYEDVRADMLAMAADPEVKEILILAASPGGSVFGISDAAEAIKKVDKQVKPVVVYSSKNVCSGMYWLAASAGKLIGSPESEWGSIGVIVTHASFEKQLADDGVKITVIKSQDLKAVGGPYQDLSDKEIAHIQEQVDQYDDLFQAHIRQSRPQVRLSGMRGETFIGAEAERMGLVDAVMGYDQVIEHIKSKRKITTQVGGYSMKMTAEELKVALDAGKTLEELGVTAEEAAQIMGEPVTIETSEGEVEIDASQAELLTQIADLTAAASAAQVQITDLTEKLAAAEAKEHPVNAEMKEIVIDVLNNRRVALGMSRIDMSAFSIESVMVDYKAVTEQFNKVIKEGGLFKKPEEKKPVSIAKDSVQAGLLQAAAI